MNFVIALMVLSQVPSGEEVCRKIEESTANALVEVKCAAGSQPATDKPEWNPKWESVKGSVLTTKDGKWQYETWNKSGTNREVREIFMSDGSSAYHQALLYIDDVLTREAKRAIEVPKRPSPGGAMSAIRKAMVRAGNAGVSNVVHAVMAHPDAKTPDIEKWYSISDAAHGEEDGDCKTVTFRLDADLGEFGGKYRELVKLWYDPSTFKVKKRWSKPIKLDPKEATHLHFWEVYDNVKLEKVPEGYFKPVKVD